MWLKGNLTYANGADFHISSSTGTIVATFGVHAVAICKANGF